MNIEIREMVDKKLALEEAMSKLILDFLKETRLENYDLDIDVDYEATKSVVPDPNSRFSNFIAIGGGNPIVKISIKIL